MIEALTDTLDITLLHPDAIAPARTRAGDAGYDLRATERVSIPQDGRRLVGTGRRRSATLVVEAGPIARKVQLTR
jgi:dUTPase